MEKLRQSKNFIIREITIQDSKFIYKISKYGDENEYKIPYENLGEKNSFKNSQVAFIIIAIVFYLFSVSAYTMMLEDNTIDTDMWIVWLIIATGFFIFYWFNRQNLWKILLSNNRHIYFEKNIPNSKTTNEFLEKLYTARNNYLRDVYLKIDSNLDYQSQLSNLKWLRNIDVISKEEFDEKYDDLTRIFKPTPKAIGFDK